MEGLCYISKLTYSYTCKLDYIVRIAQLDNFTQHNIVQEQNIIEYVIDHSNCVKLSDLLYWIAQKLVRMHLQQIMWLCNEIIQKYYALIQQGIQHNYLSIDRVWIKLKPGTEKFRIIYSKLYYTIHFVGYQCPFYERKDYKQYQIRDDIGIQQIIIEILRVAQQYLRKSVLDKAKGSNVFSQLNDSINKGLLNFQMQVISIIDANMRQKEQNKKLENSFINPINDEQRLSKIDRHYVNLITGNRRARRVFDISKNISEIVQQHYNQDNWYLFEVLFYNTVPLLVEVIKGKFIYDKVKPKVTINQQKPNDYFQIDGEAIDDLIKQFDEQKNAKFKFEIDLKEVKTNILLHVLKAKAKLHYFYNNVEFTIKFNDELKKQIENIKQHLINDYSKQIYEEMQEQKIYELALDLI